MGMMTIYAFAIFADAASIDRRLPHHVRYGMRCKPLSCVTMSEMLRCLGDMCYTPGTGRSKYDIRLTEFERRLTD